jgi:hypothetical protein
VLVCCGALRREWHVATLFCDALIRSVLEAKRTYAQFPEAFRRGLSETGSAVAALRFRRSALAAANALLSFPSMRQTQPPRPRSRRSRSRAPARWSRPRRQRARQKLCGSYRPKLWSALTGQPVLFRRSCCFLTERTAGMFSPSAASARDCQNARPHLPINVAGPRRRGDRIAVPVCCGAFGHYWHNATGTDALNLRSVLGVLRT